MTLKKRADYHETLNKVYKGVGEVGVRRLRYVFAVVAALLLGAWLFPADGLSAECGQWVAKAVSIQGPVEARRGGQVQWSPAHLNDVYCPGDMVRVRESGRAELLLSNDTTLRLDQKTTVTFGAQEKERGVVAELLSGVVHFFSRLPRSLKVVTPSVNAAVKGTEAVVRVDSGETTVTVLEGEVLLDNQAGSIVLTSGQTAVALKGQAPVLRLVARPRDAVQWTLYYPTVVSYCPEGHLSTGNGAAQSVVRESVLRYCQGDITGAFEALSAVPGGLSDPAVLVYRASLLLTVGRVHEAQSDIDRVASAKPSDSDGLALGAIISLVLNDREESLQRARRAAEANPRSASARISLSYALQAKFDLSAALTAAKEAVEVDRANPLAWARVAELYQSLGYLDESLKAAEKAADLYPGLSRTQSMLGFAFLTQVRTGEAEGAFGKALTLDQADPLPRLGTGLARIRSGRLEEGRREIEIAAGLDPGSSLIRSYLGKAYYEEKRDDRAGREFAAAKELDPLDPTPWFYDAVLKQSVNRPVEALRDMQRAIDLNDNRAVYRSRLLLDGDLAARSASLSRIYTDLNFQQLGLVEGWKSVNTDPANFSAHRLLSDSYSALPRHEIARVSELLQSQLLQPININPVQASLAQPNLFILSGGGPTEPSFLEFNPLFNRNRASLLLSGIAGSDSTFGEEVVLSGVWDKLSFSLGQFHYETKGFRANNDQRQNIYDLFAQVSLSPRTSIQAEYRYRDWDRGDLELRFDPGDFLPNLRQTEKTNYARLGFHHSFAPGSDLIAWAGYQNLKEDTVNSNNLSFGTVASDIEIKQDGYVVEAQHIFRSHRFSLVSGGGYFSADQRVTDSETLTLAPPAPPLPPQSPSVSDRDLRHANLYVYTQINYPDPVVFTLGASGDFQKGGLIDRDQFNPKVGVTWSPFAATTVRAAVFKTLARPFINQQTIEPTQVAGFNQFFDDADSTESWVYGVALDQRLSKNLFGGLEYFQRDLEVPARTVSLSPTPGAPPVTEIVTVDWKERLGRAYLYWTPHRWLALSAQYYYERFDRDEEFSGGIEKITTHRVPLGVGFYHPSGFFAGLVGTYVDQEGRFLPQGSALGAPALPGSDSFWVFDASAGYRLPKRLGIITLVCKNLFDKSFNFQDTDRNNPSMQPGRSVFVRATLSL